MKTLLLVLAIISQPVQAVCNTGSTIFTTQNMQVVDTENTRIYTNNTYTVAVDKATNTCTVLEIKQ
ncbi:hypothetical protein [Klebsiella pneumoniae]|uniref:hypothetical protein n=1 Tax=Klebsiella pneumoniae TaxID=573 RepID=UPI000E2E0ABF|nr:hypothetical protein [Klebsiella pneumoniae]SXB99905.1 Uncharacterised protein [Klebsiella pneumoniae]